MDQDSSSLAECAARLQDCHVSDLHYKGDKAYLERVVARLNELKPDVVCFTGDIVEDAAFLQEALDIMGQIRVPMFGVPGNHEYWSNVPFDKIAKTFAATGGKWLVDEETLAVDGRLVIVGTNGSNGRLPHALKAQKRLLLVHYPEFVARLPEGETFDAILAGHSHGGQVRIPGWGALILPDQIGPYDRGLFTTPGGPLYVNPGIGTWYLNVRFWCRPEIALIDL